MKINHTQRKILANMSYIIINKNLHLILYKIIHSTGNKIYTGNLISPCSTIYLIFVQLSTLGVKGLAQGPSSSSLMDSRFKLTTFQAVVQHQLPHSPIPHHFYLIFRESLLYNLTWRTLFRTVKRLLESLHTTSNSWWSSKDLCWTLICLATTPFFLFRPHFTFSHLPI